MKETAKHQRAFEAYYALGSKRSLPTVARQLGVSAASVKKWSATFSWQQRVADREEAVGTAVRERATTDEVDHRSRNRKIVQAGIIATARAIAEGRVVPKLSDLDRLIRLESFLEGEPDSRQELVGRDLRSKTTAELRAMLRTELRELAYLTGEEDGEFELLGEGPNGTSRRPSQK